MGPDSHHRVSNQNFFCLLVPSFLCLECILLSYDSSTPCTDTPHHPQCEFQTFFPDDLSHRCCHDSYVTREERDALKTRFFKSHLSKVNPPQYNASSLTLAIRLTLTLTLAIRLTLILTLTLTLTRSLDHVSAHPNRSTRLKFKNTHTTTNPGLRQLNEEEVMEWLTYRKCMPTDLTKYVKRLKAAHLNGLALWEVGVKNPSLLKVEFGIVSPLQRRTIVQAICREIEGLGCLGEGQGLTQPIPGATSRGLPAGGVASVNPQDQFFLSKEQGGRDANHDGQVSKAEFTKEQGAGSAEAFSCLDPDDDGQITREEMFELKTRFFRSRLSHLTVEETRAWISSQKCVPIDMSEHLGAFRAKEINGLSLWKYGVKNPSLLRTVLGIQSEIKRATLTQVQINN